MCVRYCSSVGRFLSARSASSRRRTTTVTPAGPRFFCAPAKIKPNRETSTARERMSRSEEHTSELQSRPHLVCRLLLEKKKEEHTSELQSRPHLVCHLLLERTEKSQSML